MSPRQQHSLAGSPVLVGAATVLCTVVAVFLAYNANNGLPFVPTYDLTVQVPDAAGLVRGNEVRIGGKRVGTIEDIHAVAAEDGGDPVSELDVALITKLDPLPADSQVTVRPRSPLGLKYLELKPGDSEEGLRAGTTMPLEAAPQTPQQQEQPSQQPVLPSIPQIPLPQLPQLPPLPKLPTQQDPSSKLLDFLMGK